MNFSEKQMNYVFPTKESAAEFAKRVAKAVRLSGRPSVRRALKEYKEGGSPGYSVYFKGSGLMDTSEAAKLAVQMGGRKWGAPKHNPGKYRVLVKQSGSPARETIAVHGQDYQWYGLDGSPLEADGAYVQEMLEEVENPTGPRENPMRLTVRDKKVIAAFLRQEQDSSKKLTSLGHRLDGNWMGGQNIASWEGQRVVFHDLGSRVAQTVQRYIESKIGKQNPAADEPEIHRLYRAAVAADDEWHQELEREFGKRRASDIRYRPEGEGKSGTRLRTAYDRFIEARDALRTARDQTKPPMGWKWPDQATIEVYDTLNDVMVVQWRFDGKPDRFYDLLKKYGGSMDGSEPRYSVRLVDYEDKALVDNGGIGGTLRYWQTQRKNPASDIDHHAATELKLYIENDAQLYRQRKQPIELNLSKKWKKGTYDEALAAKVYMYLVDDGAKKYAKEFGGTWNKTFTPATRREVARQFAEEFTIEARLGNLTENPRVSGGRRNPIMQADHTPFGWKEEQAQPELLMRKDGLALPGHLADGTLYLLAAYNDGDAPTLKPEEVFRNIIHKSRNRFDVEGLYEGTYAQDVGSLVTFSQDGSGPVAEYLSVGDPYIPTVLYDYEQNQFYITGWGDWLAKWEEEHGEDRDDGEDW